MSEAALKLTAVTAIVMTTTTSTRTRIATATVRPFAIAMKTVYEAMLSCSTNRFTRSYFSWRLRH